MDFFGAIKSGFKNYANFRGVASRSEYWYFFLFNFISGMVVFVLDLILNLTVLQTTSALPMPGLLYVIWMTVLLLPSTALLVRRVRDSGQSWIWVLVQQIFFLITLAFVALVVGGFLTYGQGIDFLSDDDEYVSAQLEILLNQHPEIAVSALFGFFFYFVAGALSMVTLIFSFLPTKSAEQGNRYLKNKVSETTTN